MSAEATGYRIAGAPISWGVCEVPGWGYQLGPDKVLAEMREVGLVEVRDAGRQRLYRVNGHALKPLHDWVRGFEAMWQERFAAMDDVLAELTTPTEEHGDGHDGHD